MEFKIDTKENYTLLCPMATHLDEKLAAAIEKKWTELVNDGANNLIIDLQHSQTCTDNVADKMIQLHEYFYNNEQSLVFINLQPQVKKQLQQHEYFEAINAAPTLIEAVDIISMEILERDLLGEGDEL